MVDWLSLSQLSGSGDTEVTVTASTHTGLMNRVATLLVSGVSKSVNVNVYQGVYVESNQVIYTSTDGNVIPLYHPATDWGANLISNVYTNGQGVLTFDGPVTSIGRGFSPHQMYSGEPSSGSDDLYSKLETILMPSTVTGVTEGAFAYCKDLVVVKMSPNVSEIGRQAFLNCNSLPNIDIPAGVTDLTGSTFSACWSLTGITCHSTTAPVVDGSTFFAVATGGTLTYPSGADYSTWLSQDRYYLGFYGWNNIQGSTAYTSYLTFKAGTSGGTVRWRDSDSSPVKNRFIWYKRDRDNDWNKLDPNSGTPVYLNPNEKVQFKGNNSKYGDDANGVYTTFGGTTGVVEIFGNIASLLNGDDFLKINTNWNYPFVFSKLFSNITSLRDAGNLEMHFRAYDLYYCSGMFKGCTSLTVPPELPAPSLYQWCYQEMFMGCTSLRTAPVLPCARPDKGVYERMFSGCTNLRYIKCLATSRPYGSATSNWVNGVYYSGTFVKPAEATFWGTGPSDIPNNWTVENV